MGRDHYCPQQYNPGKNMRSVVRSNDSYLVKRVIKDAKEAQNFNPQMMRLGEAMLNSDIPTYMVIGAALIMIGAGMGGGLAGEVHSVDHSAEASHGHYSPAVNDTPAPAAPVVHAPVNVEPAQAYQAQAVVSNNSTNNSSHDYQPAKEVSTQAYEPKESKATLEERVAEKTPEQPVIKAMAHGRSTGDEGGAHGRGSTDYEIKNVSKDTANTDIRPVLYDNSLVWVKDHNDGSFDVMYKNLTSGEVKTLQVNNMADMKQIDIWGNNVIFIKHDVNGDRNIFVADKESGVVSQLTHYDNHMIDSLRICGENVVYNIHNISANNNNITLLNKITGASTMITDSDSAVNPDIFEDHVVYHEKTDNKIKVYTISTGETKNLDDTTGLQQKQPRISGDKVAFIGSYDGSKWNVFVKDIKTGELKQLTNDSDDPADDSGLDINNGKLIWSENVGHIHVYDLSNDTWFNCTKAGVPTIFGNKFAYDSDETGEKEIFLATEKGTTPTNHAPTVEDIVDSTIEYNGTWEKPIVANDSDGDPLAISVIGDAFQKLGDKVVLKESYRTLPGTYPGRVKVDDGKGGVTEDSFTVIVKEKPFVPPVNHEPTFSSMPGQFDINNNGWTIDLKEYASDPDGDALTYKTTSDILVDKGNGMFGLKTGTKPGTYNAKFIITDEHGASKETTAKFIVKDPGTTTHTDPGIPWYAPVVGGLTAAALGIAAFFGYKKKKKATRYTNGHTPPAQHPAKGRRPVRVNGRA